jgi:AcrR family transcriptional regulator
MALQRSRRERAPAPNERKARGRGHERRGEILAAAKDLFMAQGFETVTTRKLADHAGISQTGLYVYFKNKEEILDALCHVTFEKLTDQLCALAEVTEPGPALLSGLMRGYIEFGLDHPDEYQLAFMVSHGVVRHHDKDLSRPIEQQPPGLQAFLMFREQIARLVEAGVVRPADPTLMTQTIWAAVHGVVALFLARPYFPWVDRETLITTLIETLCAGLRAEER